jgi:hypothetical protein
MRYVGNNHIKVGKMKRAKKNKYQKKQDRRSLKEIMKEPGKQMGKAGKNMLVDVVVGVVAGGATGAMIGKPSLITGLLVNFAGHFVEVPLLSTFGMGMMAANGFQTEPAISGNEGMVERAKQRLIVYKNNFLQKTYIDKLKKGKVEVATDQPVGEVKYFVYPHANGADLSAMDLTDLDRIENQIMQAAVQFDQKEPIAQMRNSVSGIDENGLMNDPLY